jgi:2-methylcitrate dehydratase PrpD
VTGLTEKIAALTSALAMPAISKTAQRWAKRSIADVAACGLAGSKEPVVSILTSTLEPATGPALILGSRNRCGALDAAQINGAAAHALDFDDCNLVLDGHPSVSIVPALFALGDMLNSNGSDLLVAYIAGIEAEVRLARLSNPAHVDRGWHPTATFGVIGCAVACARLLNLNTGATARAIAIAASSSSGLRANSGTMTKPLHAGMANRNGLQAALLASRGMTANPQALEHKMGFLAAYNGSIPDALNSAFDDWGQHSALEEPGIAIKQYPCCAFIHCAIDAAIELRGRGQTADAESIIVHLHPRRLRNIDRPVPKDGLDARFSTQYLTARSVLNGTIRLDDFDGPALADGPTRALMQRVTLQAHGNDDMNFGEVEIVSSTGDRHKASASVAMGRDPANPMTDDQFYEKFRDCSSSCLDAGAIADLYQSLMTLELQSSIRLTTRLMEEC